MDAAVRDVQIGDVIGMMQVCEFSWCVIKGVLPDRPVVPWCWHRRIMRESPRMPICGRILLVLHPQRVVAEARKRRVIPDIVVPHLPARVHHWGPPEPGLDPVKKGLQRDQPLCTKETGRRGAVAMR